MMSPRIYAFFILGCEDVETALRAALKNASPAQAAGLVARQFGADRKTLYARALELQGK